LLFLPLTGFGQLTDSTITITDTTNIDHVYKQARELAYAGKYSWARNYCQKILEVNPGYTDVKLFIGRTYAWEKNFEQARSEYSEILLEHENNMDALLAMVELEVWAGNGAIANQYLTIALNYYPNNVDLLLKKASVELQQNQKQNASMTLRKLLSLYPGNKTALRMINEIAGRKYRNTFHVQYLIDLFENNRSPQQFASAEYGRNFRFGTVILRVNGADRFNQQGYQPEIETYIHFTKGTYMNMIAGFSDYSIFPKEKYGAELYQRLPAGFEISAGIRYQKFQRTSTIYTASLSNYFRNYWFNVRAFLTPRTDSTSSKTTLKNTSTTLLLNIRRYFGDGENYFGIRVGQGRSPDENRALDIATQLLSYQGGAELQFGLTKTFYIKATAVYARESPRPNYFTQRYTSGLSLKKFF
jgi:YaiO family outer membrane protein